MHFCEPLNQRLIPLRRDMAILGLCRLGIALVVLASLALACPFTFNVTASEGVELYANCENTNLEALPLNEDNVLDLSFNVDSNVSQLILLTVTTNSSTTAKIAMRQVSNLQKSKISPDLHAQGVAFDNKNRSSVTHNPHVGNLKTG